MGKIFFRLGDDHFERLDFVSFVLLIETNATYDAVVNAFWLKANQVKYFTNMISSLATVWILELFSYWLLKH